MRSEQPPKYEEQIAAPLWLMAILTAAILALVVAMIAVAFDPDAGWQLLAWYYPLMAFAGVLLLAVTAAFRRLRIAVNDSGVRMSFGFIHKTLPAANIEGCEVQKYRWLTYGGWGIRFASGGRRAWSMPGVLDGVKITVKEDMRVRRYFVSSRSPELLSAAVANC